MAQGFGGYYKGDQVETHSLGKADFNGHLCTVVDFKESEGRVVVELPQSARDAAKVALAPLPETINVKPANLTLSQAGEEREVAEDLRQAKEYASQQQEEGQSTETLKKEEKRHQQDPETSKKLEEEQQRQDEKVETSKEVEGETLKKEEEEKPQCGGSATNVADASTFAVGDLVELHSLSTASLNGERGKVVGLPEGDRLRVDLGKLGIKAFKPANLKLVELTPEELMWKARLAALQKVAFVRVPTGWDPKPVLMAVVSALEPCGDLTKGRKARLGDVVMGMYVERRISPELGGEAMTMEEVMAGLEKKLPTWNLERRQDHWDRLDKKDKTLEAIRCASRVKEDDNAWTLEKCECARVVEVTEDGDFFLENRSGAVSELSSRSRFGFVGAKELSKSAGGCVIANQPNLLPVGCRVRTFGLSATENNDLEGVVENYFKEKDRYEVNFGDKSLALKRTALLQRVDVQLADGTDTEASVVDFKAGGTTDFSLRVNGEKRQANFNDIILNHTAHVDGVFRNGARIIVHSLSAEAAKQWNECMGEVVGYDKDVQRYLIQVSQTAQLKIKRDNLRFCPL